MLLKKDFEGGLRATLIQDQGQTRNLESKIYLPGFHRFKFEFHSFFAETFSTVSVKFRHCSDVRCATALPPKAAVSNCSEEAAAHCTRSADLRSETENRRRRHGLPMLDWPVTGS